ncbi:uncharacterized protein RSE6_14755 [Rhynchosporium secalis]|uniref:Uncharacterized protein n=1 Tax=Rhynchosporium secalis TaxID=38038 RepID=A0A1E1MW05_RHYSE|nr:uncharacterized protein RSE6_14755 [Rhynchosporium secalis]
MAMSDLKGSHNIKANLHDHAVDGQYRLSQWQLAQELLFIRVAHVSRHPGRYYEDSRVEHRIYLIPSSLFWLHKQHSLNLLPEKKALIACTE